MARIIYPLPTQGAVQGGHKVILRHVESLRRLGFDAYCYQGAAHKRPTWLDYSVPFDPPPPLRDDDYVVLSDDSAETLTNVAKVARERCVVLSQNPYYFALRGFGPLDLFPAGRLPAFIAVSDGLKRMIERAYPGADVHIVPCFADERIFMPRAEKTFSVAYSPKKRTLETEIIKQMFRKLHPRHADLGWIALDKMREPEVANAMGGASLFLSLSRLESVGMTTLEAMACRCLCAGFTGVGGGEYATPQNGFWVADDDCVAAADALAHAADLVRARAAEVDERLAAGAMTAEAWSHRRYEEVLEAVWMRLAPDARCI
jgi:hypothetical protein